MSKSCLGGIDAEISSNCLAFAAAGCGNELSDSEQTKQAEAAVAAVERVNNAAPPMVEVVPEPLGYPDIEANDIFGQSCAYAPGTSLGARVIARESDAFMKVDGKCCALRQTPALASCRCARALPIMDRPIRCASPLMTKDTPDPQSEETTLYSGTIFLRDRWDRVVYQGSGTVSCGS